MEFQGRAFFNFLKAKKTACIDFDVEQWQVEDYRVLSDEALFSPLDDLDIQMNREMFNLYIEKCGSPEELASCLALEGQDEHLYDRVYLCVFELWRRFCSTKPTLSIFCDELDHLIIAFDEHELDDVDVLIEHLLELGRILDRYVDEGMDAHEAFYLIDSYCAHDVESFVYDFISALLDDESFTSASQMLDAYYPYVEDRRWLDLLRARLLMQTDVDEAKMMMERLFDELQQQPDIDLGLEMLRLLIGLDEREAFQLLLDQISIWVQTEDDFQQILCIVRDYFCALDREEQEHAIDEMLKSRENHDPDAKFFPTDAALKTLKQVVSVQLVQAGRAQNPNSPLQRTDTVCD